MKQIKNKVEGRDWAGGGPHGGWGGAGENGNKIELGKPLVKKKKKESYKLIKILLDILNEMYVYGHFMSAERYTELANQISNL